MNWKGEFEVEDTMVHYVETSRDTENPDRLLTSATINLTDDLRAYFSTQISERVGSRSLEVVKDPEGNATITDAILTTITDRETLIENSRLLAEHLFQEQTGQNSSGLLAVLTGRFSGKEAVAIVKLQRQRGINFTINPETGTVDLALLKNLTLTDQSKIFKTALFIGQGSGPSLLGVIADSQRTSRNKGRLVATFFLKFLGCKAKDPAAETTYIFVAAANEAFSDVSDMKAKSKYQIGLMAELESNSTDLCPASFADKYISNSTDRDNFLAHMEDKGLAPDMSFSKDTSRVNVDTFSMTFDGTNIVVAGTKNDLENHMYVPSNPGPDDPVAIKAKIKESMAGTKKLTA